MKPRHSLFSVWSNMKNRCLNEHADRYDDYGGRGITICHDWLENFESFKLWALSNGYMPGLYLDRENNNLGYSPSNCRWVPMSIQNRNRRDNLLVTAFGETKVCIDWERDPRCKVAPMTFRFRIYAGWQPELALTKPKLGHKFTDDIKKFIQENYLKMEDKEISNLFNISVSAISSWRFNNGLTKFKSKRTYSSAK